MITSKPWWASKTVWLGVLEMAIGTLKMLADSELTGGDLDSGLLTVAGMLTVVVRFLTNQPLNPIGAAPEASQEKDNS